VAEARQHRLGRKQPKARDCQLNGQWQAVKPRTDLDHRHRVLSREGKIGSNCGCALDKQRNGLELGQCVECEPASGTRKR